MLKNWSKIFLYIILNKAYELLKQLKKWKVEQRL